MSVCGGACGQYEFVSRMVAARIVMLAAICCVWCKVYNAKLIVQMTRAEVVNTLHIANASASIKRFGTKSTNYVADFQVAVFQKIEELQVSTLFYIPTFNGNLEKAIYNRTVNFCSYLRRPSIDRILQMIYEELNQRGNLPKRCPVAPGTYSFNTSFDGFRLPGFLRESNFRFDLNFYRGLQRELCFESHWYGRLRKILSN